MPPPIAPTSPLGELSRWEEATFATASRYGAQFAVVRVRGITPIREGSLETFEGTDHVIRLDVAWVDADVLASQSGNSDLRFRIFSGSTCGSATDDPDWHACIDTSFQPDRPIQIGDHWAIAYAPASSADGHAWSAVMAGHRLASGDRAQEALDELRRTAEGGVR